MIKELFQSENIFLQNESLSYSDFYKLCLENAHAISNNSKIVSIQVDHTTTSLIDLISLWILGKSVIIYSNLEPEENILIRNKELNSNNIEKNNTQFNNTMDLKTDLSEVAVYLFTSGSSSKPKAIPLTFKNLFNSARNFNDFYKVNSNHYLPTTLPIFHIGGLQILIRTILSSSKTDFVKPGSFSSESFKVQPDFLSVVPLQLEKLFTNNQIDNFKNTTFIIGGAKLANTTIKKIENNKIKASVTYGMTETTAMCMSTVVTSNSTILKTVGLPLGNTTISLTNDSRLIISSECVSPLFKNSSITTNDLAHIDEEGRYIINGRSDSVFISGGENINPSEIEEVLLDNGYPYCFLTNVEDIKLQSAGFLFFDSSYKKEDIEACCKKNLHPHKVPRYFFSTSTNQSELKIKRSILKTRAQEISNILKLKSPIPFNCHGDPSKEWVLLIHGFTGDQNDWIDVISNLDNNFFFITIDCPGHGNFVLSQKIELNVFLSQLNTFISALSKEVHLLGYSQGARVALSALIHGTKVKSLILESGSVGIVDEIERETRYKSDLNLLLNIKSKNDLKDFFISWYSNSLFGNFTDSPKFKNLVLKKLEHDHKQWQLSLQTLSVGLQENFRPKLLNIEVPKLIICGSKDHKYFAQAKELEVQYDFFFESIQDVSHNTHFETPVQFSNVVKKFINSIS